MRQYFLFSVIFLFTAETKKTFVVNLKPDEACFSPLLKANLLRLVKCSFISTNTVGVVCPLGVPEHAQ